MKKSNDDRHGWCKFIDRNGDTLLGFTCGSHQQVLTTNEAQTERHVTAHCQNCAALVHYDAGALFQWRRWLLPRVAFTIATKPRPPVWSLPEQWTGEVHYQPIED